MTTLLIFYFVMTTDARWEFLTIEHEIVPGYCEELKTTVQSTYRGKPGNMRVVCAEDQGLEL